MDLVCLTNLAGGAETEEISILKYLTQLVGAASSFNWAAFFKYLWTFSKCCFLCGNKRVFNIIRWNPPPPCLQPKIGKSSPLAPQQRQKGEGLENSPPLSLPPYSSKLPFFCLPLRGAKTKGRRERGGAVAGGENEWCAFEIRSYSF